MAATLACCISPMAWSVPPSAASVVERGSVVAAMLDIADTAAIRRHQRRASGFLARSVSAVVVPRLSAAK